MPVQFGGGIRDMKTVDAGWPGRCPRHHRHGGGRRPRLVREAARVHPGRIAVGIDARDGQVAVEGWARFSQMTAEAVGMFEDAGVARSFTDIARDGAMRGLNVESTLKLAGAVSVPVIVLAGSPPSPTSNDCSNPIAPSCRALFPAARSMTAARPAGGDGAGSGGAARRAARMLKIRPFPLDVGDGCVVKGTAVDLRDADRSTAMAYDTPAPTS
jgi:hypothetical protein